MLDMSKPIAVAHRVGQMQLAALALGTTLDDLDPETAQARDQFGFPPPEQVMDPEKLQRRVQRMRERLADNPEAYLNFLRRFAVPRKSKPRRKRRSSAKLARRPTPHSLRLPT